MSDQITDDLSIDYSYTYQLLECCGCETVSLVQRIDFEDDPEPRINIFPPRVSRRAPPWAHELSTDARELLSEVYAALHADSRRLAMMGARALLDLFTLQKVGDVGRFDQKLAALEAQGYVSSRNREVLEAALDAGSAAVHRAHKPTIREVNQVIDIVESLLQHDVLQRAAADLKKKTPSRRKPGPG